MRLLRAKVMNYKSIDDSGWVNIDNVTSLVGKNESGKTTFLQAIYKINPVDPDNGNFNLLDYPRKGFAKYKRTHDENPATVVSTEFELSDDEIEQIEDELGEGVLASNIITASKNYKNVRSWTVKTNESAAIKHFVNLHVESEEKRKQYEGFSKIEDLITFIQKSEEKDTEDTALQQQLENKFKDGFDHCVINKHLVKLIPKLLLFADYSIMKGKISIQHLKQRRDQQVLDDSERTFLSLLSVAGVELEDFENQQNYERVKADLEAASISITDEVFEFWSQNKQLEVEFDISNANPTDLAPLNSGTILHVRIKNNRHRVTVPFDERSKGFVWFFSFLAYFSQLEEKDSKLILLLDEPGLSLHAKAQNDFLRLIDERLATNHQVIYTTHSPFMINPNKLDNVRTVQDIDDKGTVISQDVLKNDKDTLFPLQAALGYEIAQTLFIGSNCLLVEGPSDLIYLQILSDVVSSRFGEGLDPKWVVVPVGGADKITTFVSLLGAHKINLAVLMDVEAKDQQRIENLKANKLLGKKNLIKVSEFTESNNADIEDLFDAENYLKLVNGAFGLNLELGAFSSKNPRIVKRIQEEFKKKDIMGGYFNHYSPAVYFLKEQVNLIPQLDENTISRAKALFERINSL